MLRNVQEILIRADGRYDVRLKCGHMMNYKFKTRPNESSTYNCPPCDIKGQGVKPSGIGYLNNGRRLKGHD